MILKKNTIIQNVYLIFIIVYPLLNNYKFIIPIGDIIALALFPLFFAAKRIKISNNISYKKYKYYIFYSIITIPMAILLSDRFNIQDIFTKNFHLVLYAIYGLYFGKKLFDSKKFFNIYIKILNILVLLAIFQQLVYYLTNTQIYYILPNISLNYSVDNYSDYIRVFNRAAASQGYRASSLFLEPAHFSFFVVIGLAYKLINEDKNLCNLLIIIMYLLSIAFSYSTGGVISALIAVCYYVFFYKPEKQVKYDFVFKISISIISIVSVIYVLSTNSLLLITILNRINSIGDTSYDTSGNRRVLRGYYIWKKLPFYNKVMGTGMGNLLETIKSKDLIVLTDAKFSDEMSCLFYNLCSVGVVGTYLYFTSLISNWKKVSSFGKLIIVIYIFSCIFNNILLHATSVIFLVLIFSERIKIGADDSGC